MSLGVENISFYVFGGAPTGPDPRRAPPGPRGGPGGGPRGGPRALAGPDARRAPLGPRAPQGPIAAGPRGGPTAQGRCQGRADQGPGPDASKMILFYYNKCVYIYIYIYIYISNYV